MTPKFKTVKGRLTAYSFACGYWEKKSTDPRGNYMEGLDTQFYYEGACYHVRQFDYRNDRNRIFWKSFKKLSEARACFDEQPGKINSN